MAYRAGEPGGATRRANSGSEGNGRKNYREYGPMLEWNIVGLDVLASRKITKME
jgi:hypothetical protein